MIKKFIIKYYFDETAYRIDCPAFKENWNGDRQSAIFEAERMLRNNNHFKFYEIEEQ